MGRLSGGMGISPYRGGRLYGGGGGGIGRLSGDSVTPGNTSNPDNVKRVERLIRDLSGTVPFFTHGRGN